jgi:hypothetical protein
MNGFETDEQKRNEKIPDEYRGFRHVVRNVYTYNLSEERLKVLVENLDKGFSQLKSELTCFLGIIDFDQDDIF